MSGCVVSERRRPPSRQIEDAISCPSVSWNCPSNRELTQLSDRGYKGEPWLRDQLGKLLCWLRHVTTSSILSLLHYYGIIVGQFATDNCTDHCTMGRQLLQLNLSGTLAPEIGQLSKMQIMDFMWNSISGSIPKEVGNITSLELLLLNGNHLSGSLPEEIGFLPNLNRIQIDQNQISGPIPKSFAFLNKTKHFHMNNNSLSGQIPPELSRLPSLVHLLLDNNNLSGYLPPELSNLPKLLIMSLDNNNLNGSIPSNIWQNIDFSGDRSLILDFQNNSLSNLSNPLLPPANYLSSGLSLSLYQLGISTFMWEEGPRLKMYLKLFPNNTAFFTASEVLRLRSLFTGWLIPDSDIFGPYELINFDPGWYSNEFSLELHFPMMIWIIHYY
ncbi:hypothetical protein PR202_gb25839 [Eleusine coracana subsp. coracana]|uniref:Uncharacterized protein n=1 Tax=Eleusine coracana subsp. coracana TaxID=191504 RepID=A0AAV5FRK9_ELECO|nr:hypothetical protein PR202_gb25803 [Eleusine coracana subsp. coracana]GJN36934.1 hypothetical protein PR202_gb25839 [Eleusine coracana subsp. coracana]